MGKSGDATVEDGSVDVILPEGFGSSFSTREIRAKVKETGFHLFFHKISQRNLNPIQKWIHES